MKVIKNNFCNLEDLTNESTVEQYFVIRLFSELGYPDSAIKPKNSLPSKLIGKGRKKEIYRPDYINYVMGKPKFVTDAKSTTENIEDYLYQVSGYSLAVNQDYQGENPIEYCLLSNGVTTKLYHWDSNQPVLSLDFGDFKQGNNKYEKLKSLISYQRFKQNIKHADTKDKFDFIKTDPNEIVGIFKACHNIIRKMDKKAPSKAFYEFVKLIFIKLSEDRKLRLDPDLVKMIESENAIPREKAIFSVHWIKNEEKTDENPVNSILFKNLIEKLEEDIELRNKKRIFDHDERLNMKPSTIRKVVELLEHRDLFGVDEDLNGRLFESFLSATMRGKELGQFFTPRSVVKFMTRLADLTVAKNSNGQFEIDRVIDGFCGSGGFLIEAMADLSKKIESKSNLSNLQKNNLLKMLKEERLFGVDAGDAEIAIPRIARINMYLHQDGGSRIYEADFLDKKIRIEAGIGRELKNDILEIKEMLTKENILFDVVLTNPPFGMDYSSDDESGILREYEIAFIRNKGQPTKRLKKSLDSRVMSIERYYDLLKPKGKLLTVMDESILNTDSQQDIRRYIRQKFNIKGIISLPRNTFVNTESAVKTSILFLTKKENPEEEQPSVFMAISSNVGHSDSGKPTPNLSDLEIILKKYQTFDECGNIQYDGDTPICFTVHDLNNRTDRIDAHYFDPRYETTLSRLKEISKMKGKTLSKLGMLLLKDVNGKPKITGGATPLGTPYVAETEGIKFLRVQNVAANHLNLTDVVYIPKFYHEKDLRRSQLQPRNILLTITGSYGISAVIPENFGDANINQHVVKMEADESKIDPFYLSIFLNTELCQRQFDREVTGGTRAALDYRAITELEVVYPESLSEQRIIVKNVLKKVQEAAVKLSEYKSLSEELKNISLSEIES